MTVYQNWNVNEATTSTRVQIVCTKSARQSTVTLSERFQSDDANPIKSNPHFPKQPRVYLTQPDDSDDQVRSIGMWMKTSQETTDEERLIDEMR